MDCQPYAGHFSLSREIIKAGLNMWSFFMVPFFSSTCWLLENLLGVQCNVW